MIYVNGIESGTISSKMTYYSEKCEKCFLLGEFPF